MARFARRPLRLRSGQAPEDVLAYVICRSHKMSTKELLIGEAEAEISGIYNVAVRILISAGEVEALTRRLSRVPKFRAQRGTSS